MVDIMNQAAMKRNRNFGRRLEFFFDNVPIALFVADARTLMLPTHMWEIIEQNLDVRAAAASGVIVIFTLLIIIVAERFAGLSRQFSR